LDEESKLENNGVQGTFGLPKKFGEEPLQVKGNLPCWGRETANFVEFTQPFQPKNLGNLLINPWKEEIGC